MVREKGLYIDSEGVQRGYYVYLHKDRATGEVFYVGTGHGRRAWETESRHSLWNQKVSSLTDGFDVEIVQDDLSELEAFELEASLVEKYGGSADTGGRLTNWMPGGEDPASNDIDFDSGQCWADLQLKNWSEAYHQARKFKDLPRKRQEEIVSSVAKELQPFDDLFVELKEEGAEDGDDELSYPAFDFRTINSGVLDAAADFSRQRASWTDFGIALENAIDDMKTVMEDESPSPRVASLGQQVITILERTISEIDSGNREEAIKCADEKL